MLLPTTTIQSNNSKTPCGNMGKTVKASSLRMDLDGELIAERNYRKTTSNNENCVTHFC